MSDVGALGSFRCSLEDLPNRAVLCVACGYGMTHGKTFSTEKRKVLVGELEEAGVFTFLKTAKGMVQRSTGGAPVVKRWRANS